MRSRRGSDEGWGRLGRRGGGGTGEDRGNKIRCMYVGSERGLVGG